MTAEDYLLYLRCPRSFHRKLAGNGSAGEMPAGESRAEDARGDRADRANEVGADELRFPVRSDREAVRELVMSEARAQPGVSTGHALSAPPFVATADLWRPQKPDGVAAVLVREASGVKRSYLVESAFLRYCAEQTGAPLARLFVMHVDKSYVRGEALDVGELFVTADVTRRVALIYPEHRARLAILARELEEDPFLERYRSVVCDRPHSCPVCAPGAEPVGDDHVFNLYRGGELARELLSDGYATIPEVPEGRLPHARQRIQQSVLRDGRPHINAEALVEFLDSLHYPLHFLDFEAVSSAVPRYTGARPWEHVPYLYSVHTQSAEETEPVHQWFLMDPREDQRRTLLCGLLSVLTDQGSIIVYGAAFETAILRRLGQWFPDYAAGVAAAIDRVVDLLQPFNEFSYYHHAQRGKVSLKTILPILTETDYGDLEVRDGYTANIAYRFLAEHPAEREELNPHLVDYCRMDTLAMVHITRELRKLAAV